MYQTNDFFFGVAFFECKIIAIKSTENILGIFSGKIFEKIHINESYYVNNFVIIKVK